MVELFGFKITRKTDEDNSKLKSFVQEPAYDGAVVTNYNGMYGTSLDLDGSVRLEAELILKYRDMASHPVVDIAVDDIVNEAIVMEEDKPPVAIVLDQIDDSKLPESAKDMLLEEFKFILEKLEFNTYAYEIFRRWYVDGRLYYHVIIDDTKPQDGIQSLRYIDPRKIRKVREKRQKKLGNTVMAAPSNDYYIYNDRGFAAPKSSAYTYSTAPSGTLKIAPDSIAHVTSELTNANGDIIISYLQKATKYLNSLRTMEDALIIYRITRAPERILFKVEVGDMPKTAADQYIKDIMTKYKNRVVYDNSTGEVRDDRRFMTMTDNYWFPARDGKGSSIEPIAGGVNLGEITDIEYFQKQLYKSLHIPISRLDSSSVYNVGRTSEINRDEIKFAKFITRLRAKFSGLFLKLLERQVLLKNTMNSYEWEAIRTDIKFDFCKDNYFEELKEIELWRERQEILTGFDNSGQFIGRYLSNEWIRKRVLRQTDDEIKQMDKQIASEQANPQYVIPEPDSGAPPSDSGGPPQ